MTGLLWWSMGWALAGWSAQVRVAYPPSPGVPLQGRHDGAHVAFDLGLELWDVRGSAAAGLTFDCLVAPELGASTSTTLEVPAVEGATRATLTLDAGEAGAWPTGYADLWCAPGQDAAGPAFDARLRWRPQVEVRLLDEDGRFEVGDAPLYATVRVHGAPGTPWKVQCTGEGGATWPVEMPAYDGEHVVRLTERAATPGPVECAVDDGAPVKANTLSFELEGRPTSPPEAASEEDTPEVISAQHVQLPRLLAWGAAHATVRWRAPSARIQVAVEGADFEPPTKELQLDAPPDTWRLPTLALAKWPAPEGVVDRLQEALLDLRRLACAWMEDEMAFDPLVTLTPTGVEGQQIRVPVKLTMARGFLFSLAFGVTLLGGLLADGPHVDVRPWRLRALRARRATIARTDDLPEVIELHAAYDRLLAGLERVWWRSPRLWIVGPELAQSVAQELADLDDLTLKLRRGTDPAARRALLDALTALGQGPTEPADEAPADDALSPDELRDLDTWQRGLAREVQDRLRRPELARQVWRVRRAAARGSAPGTRGVRIAGAAWWTRPGVLSLRLTGADATVDAALGAITPSVRWELRRNRHVLLTRETIGGRSFAWEAPSWWADPTPPSTWFHPLDVHATVTLPDGEELQLSERLPARRHPALEKFVPGVVLGALTTLAVTFVSFTAVSQLEALPAYGASTLHEVLGVLAAALLAGSAARAAARDRVMARVAERLHGTVP